MLGKGHPRIALLGLIAIAFASFSVSPIGANAATTATHGKDRYVPPARGHSHPWPRRSAKTTAGKSILIYGDTLNGSPDNEQTLAQDLGYTVTVADDPTWSAMTTAQFASYNAIVFGDPSCSSDPSILDTAIANETTWAAAVTGPIVAIGTDPVYHQSQAGTQADQLSLDAIASAASGSSTGLYANLSCYYAMSPPQTAVPLLAAFGSFTVEEGATGCDSDISIVSPGSPVVYGINDAGLSGWNCSVHEAFDSYPAAFTPIVVDTDFNPPFPYILTDRLATPPPVGGAVGTGENPGNGNPGAPNDCPSQGSDADPCNTASGSFSETATDLSVAGRGIPMSFIRTYNSVFTSVNGPLGYGWTDNNSMSLSVNTTTGNVTINQENGSQLVFTSTSGTYTAPPRVLATLTKNTDGTFALVRDAKDTYTFSVTGQLTAARDLNGYVTTFTYNPSGQLTTVTDQAGRHLTLAYSGTHISSITDPLGRVGKYAYDGSGNLATVTDVGGAITSYTYDPSHLMLTKRDPRGATVTNVYDGTGRVTSQKDALGRTTTFAYTGDYLTPSGGTTTITDPAGNVTIEDYANGERVSVTEGYGTSSAATTLYTYDPTTLGITSMVDPDGHETTSTYDANGNLLSTTNPLGETTSYTYNALNESLTSTDPLGDVTTNAYDTNGNLLSTSTPLTTTTTQVTSYHYADSTHPGDLTSVTNPTGHTTTYTYDTYGNRLSATDPAGDKTTMTYNVIGWQLTQVSPKGNATGGTPSAYTTTYTHDIYGEVTSIKDPLGHTSTSSYDADHNLVTAVDALGHSTHYAYDLDNEQIVLTRPDGSTQVTTYNPDGTVASQTDGAGSTSTYTYDPLHRVISVTDPLGRSTLTSYDAAGNVIAVTDAAGAITTYGYDAANEQTSISYSDGVTPGVTFQYDADSQRIQMVDGTGTWTWTYDSLHRVTSVVDDRGVTTAYNYDLSGNLTTLTYPGGLVATYAYDPDDRMTSVKDWNGKLVKFAYDADSNLTKTTGATGTKETDTSTYDAADRLMSIKDKKGTAVVFSAAYQRNADNLLTADSSLPTATRDDAYTSLNQICVAGSSTTATCATPPSGSTQYAYNGAGDPTRLSTQHEGYDSAGEICWQGTGTSTSCTVPPTGATTFSFSSDGARLAQTPSTGSATNYSYDDANRLTAWSQGSASAGYVYNGDGLRVQKTIGTTTTDFTWNQAGPLPLLLEEDTGTNTVRYIYGPNQLPVEQVTASQTVFFHADALGSTRRLTSTAGAVVGTFAYDAYGNLTTNGGTVTTPLLYAGQYRDAESGLYYLRARYYDPRTAQFLTVDPALNATHTPYVYAADNPINGSDPSGRFLGVDTVLGAAIGGVVGTVVGATSYAVSTVVTGQPWSWQGFAGATVGGLVGGAVTGGCLGTTAALAAAACGALGGVAGGAVDQVITTGHLDPVGLAEDAALGAAGGYLLGGPKLVGFRPTLIRNLWDPGINAIRMYEDDALGGIVDLGRALLTPTPVC